MQKSVSCDILFTMKFVFENENKIISQIIEGNVVNLSEVGFLDPWTMVLVCLLLIERHNSSDKKVVLPKSEELLKYLRRMRFNDILNELGYNAEAELLERIQVPERYNMNIHEITHCSSRDQFDGRLGRFISMFQHFGLDENEAKRATSVIGELGNNTFDHNLGNWPTDIGGCIIAAQNYPNFKRIQVVVGDPGVGFFGSLKAAFPELKSDIEAIKKGLAGNTGRIGEVRGNGLRIIQNWTIDNFSGILAIHSGEGFVRVDKEGIKDKKVHGILGTLAQIMIHYN